MAEYTYPLGPRSVEPERVRRLKKNSHGHPARPFFIKGIDAAVYLGLELDDDMIDRIIEFSIKHCIASYARENPALEDAKHEPVVYYMRMNDRVKIGTTECVPKRLATVGAEAVLAIEFGSKELESERHSQFARYRTHREWFKLEGRLADHVKSVRKRFEAEYEMTTEQWFADQLELVRDLQRSSRGWAKRRTSVS